MVSGNKNELVRRIQWKEQREWEFDDVLSESESDDESDESESDEEKSFEGIAKKMVGDNFYIDDYTGMLFTDVSFSDLQTLEQNPFVALEKLEDAFCNEIKKKYPKYYNDFSLRLVYSCDQSVLIGIQK